MPSKDYVFYEEVAPPPWWVLAIVWGSVGAVGLGGAGALVAAAVAAAAFHLLFGRLRVVVSRTSVRMVFGHTRLIQKLVTFDEIEYVEPVRYSPLRDFGGWGIRFGRGRRAWTIRGDGAVVLGLDDGTRLYVGSDTPERLAERIRSAMAMAGRAPAGAETEETSDGTEAR